MKLKKLISILLVLVMVFSLAGCSGKKDEETNNTTDPATTEGDDAAAEDPTVTEAPVEEVSNAPEVVDLGGYEFVVADVNQNRWFPEEGSSEVANAIIERVKWVEDTYNCKITFRQHNETEFADAVLSGDKYADILICPTWEIGRHVGAGRIMDISQVPGVDMTKDYWTAYNNTQLLSYGDKIYGVGAPFASQADEVFVMFFNKAIIEELGLESPYDLVAKDQWTFEKFLEYEKAASKDLNGDGVMDSNDRYGFATGHDWDVSVVMYLASGNKILKQAEDGSITYGVNTPEAFDSINMIKQMVAVGDTFYPKPEGSDMDAYCEAFTQGKALFYTYSRGRGVADKIYEMEDDFGIVPIPKGNNTDKYQCWVSHDAPSMAVPITNPDIEKTGIIIEALAYAAQKENDIAFDEYCLTKLRDEESAAILADISQYAVSDLCFIGQQMVGAIYEGLGIIPNVCFYGPTTEIASAVAEVEVKVETGIEEFVQKMMGTYVAPEETETATD
ncbi:MAG: transporter substrate-binding protein [Herbinix sp.]|jgi:ABC-type glycerol-3-phosphate transport system substrate-binding protein|nr:transporter substrate-binding protein [Herbinix sp.]